MYIYREAALLIGDGDAEAPESLHRHGGCAIRVDLIRGGEGEKGEKTDRVTAASTSANADECFVPREVTANQTRS